MSRFKRTLKFVGLGAAALAACTLLVNITLNAQASARLERKVAALRDAGEPVTVAALKPPPVVPEKNAATYLFKAQAGMLAIQRKVSAVIEFSTPEDQDRFIAGQLSPAIKEAIQAGLAEHPQVIGLLEQASTCPDYDPPLNYAAGGPAFQNSVLRTSGLFPTATRVLHYQALLQLADGKRPAALDTCLAMFRLCRLCALAPTLTNYLVAAGCLELAAETANLVLRSGQLPEDSYQALDVELARFASDEPYRHALITERPFGLQGFRELNANTGWGPIGMPWVKNEACGYLDLIQQLIELADRPYEDAERALATNTTIAAAGPMTHALVPPLESTLEARCRVHALTLALRALNALVRRPLAPKQPSRSSPASDCPNRKRSTPSTASRCT